MSKTKKLFNGLAKLGIGILAYDFTYRMLHSLKQSHEEEVNLEELDISIDEAFPWIREENYQDQMTQLVNPYLANCLNKGRIERKGVKINYSYYTAEGTQGTIILVHGYNEFCSKYAELIYYFMNLSYDVLCYDARGHGSSKISSDDILIDLEDFDDYVSDLDALISHIDSNYPMKQPLFLYGHSMGGAVALAMSHDYPALFKGLILSSPMLNIECQPFPRSIAYLVSHIALLPSVGKERIPMQTDPERDYSLYQYSPHLSTSKERTAYYHQLNHSSHKMPTQCGTINWLKASMTKLNQMSKESYLREISVPVLIFKSQSDSVVRNDGITNAAHHMENATLFTVEGVGHELYIERDEILRPYVSLMAEFLEEIQ